MVRYLSSSRVPSPGVATTGRWMLLRRGTMRGRAGEISVSVRTSSGRRAASWTATAPPIELPNRCTGAPCHCCCTRSASSSAVRRGDQPPSRGGGDQPNPGRSTAMPSTRSRSRAIRSVQFVDWPPRPCTNSAGSALTGSAGAARRTVSSSPPTCTSLRGQSTGRSASRSSRYEARRAGSWRHPLACWRGCRTGAPGAPYRCCAHEGGELLVEPSFDGREEGAGHRLALESGEAAGGPPAADDQQLVHLG